MNTLIKNFLFRFDPEKAHALALKSLQFAYQTGISKFFATIPDHPITLMGITFPNRIGLAAGFDKNADYVDALATLGFGFIEVGTVTPKPQTGNPKPRLFRLTEQEAIINRMGFNNKGVDYVAKRLANTKYRGVLGINIGKNRDTSLDNAIDDYLFAMRALWQYASYITINISSPNTPGLRDLQQSDYLSTLLQTLKKEQESIANREKKYVPLVVKISPDLSIQEVDELAHTLLQQQIDGVIATNTTIQRDGVLNSSYAKESGGLSGRPLQKLSTHIIKTLANTLEQKIPIIASGGIMDRESAQEKLAAGASLLQVYSGFIFQGPKIIHQLSSTK